MSYPISTHQKGNRAESLVMDALVRAGHTIIERNWACPLGEIDIVTRHDDEIVIVEVRARSDGIEAALESIGPRKQARLAQLAAAYLNAQGWADCPHRVDVVAVDTRSGQIEIIQNAVGW